MVDAVTSERQESRFRSTGHAGLLVSFALFAYNQEEFIREAVVGALSQSYSPLEIILSDDSSSDRTYEIMEELARQYEGPHRVILNRNPRNLGMAGQVNFVMGGANGDLVVFAAADDVSIRERTAVLAQNWLKANRPLGIGSGMIRMNVRSETIDEIGPGLSSEEANRNFLSTKSLLSLVLEQKRFWLWGCTAAWSKEAWNLFGPLKENTVEEDVALSFRAALQGGLCFVDDKLVRYRIHQRNSSSHCYSERFSIGKSKLHAFEVTSRAKRAIPLLQTHTSDVAIAERNGLLERRSVDALNALIKKQLAVNEIRQDWWRCSLLKKLRHWEASPYRSCWQTVLSFAGFNVYCLVDCFVYLLRHLRTLARKRG